jgi:hypothetical protein
MVSTFGDFEPPPRVWTQLPPKIRRSSNSLNGPLFWRIARLVLSAVLTTNRGQRIARQKATTRESFGDIVNYRERNLAAKVCLWSCFLWASRPARPQGADVPTARQGSVSCARPSFP